MNFNNEKVAIVNKFEKAGYPTRFISSVIKQFEERLEPTNVENELIIPEFFFQEIKRRIIIEIPFCVKNEIATKRFITKLKAFTHDKYEFIIKWITKKVKQLFSTKDKDPHPSCKTYMKAFTHAQLVMLEKQSEMLLLDGKNMKTQTRIQSQQNI